MQVQLTREDVNSFVNYIIFKNVSPRKIGLMLFVPYCVVSQTLSLHSVIVSIIAGVIAVLIMFLLLYGWPYFDLKSVANKQYNDPLFKERYTVALTETGIKLTSENHESLWRYENMKNISYNAHYLYVLMYDRKFLLFPLREFQDQAEASNFTGIVLNKIANLSVYLKNQRPERLYKWGFLGLIPLVGGIVGLIFLLRGIFEFKDVKLGLIGIGGLAFTIGFYTFLYEFSNSPAGKKGIVTLVQNNLNTLSQQIEYYKYANGTYPDSLKQVTGDKSSSLFIDWMGNLSKKTILHYQKIGDKYTLFSVGIDNIPYTKDDLYPNYKVKDTAKFGLVKLNGTR